MEFETPLSAFLHWENTIPDKLFLQQPVNGEVKTYTWHEAGQEARKVAAGLRSLDLPPGSRVALLSKNCAHWIMADLAIMMAGHVSVPIYPTLSEGAIQAILEHSGTAAIIVGKLDDFESQKGATAGIHSIGVGLYGTDLATTWEKMVEGNAPLEYVHEQKPDDLMTIVYTSGTTGTPKGVMHSAGTLARVNTIIHDLIFMPEFPRFFSYLPLAHIAERGGVEVQALIRGATISFPGSLETFAKDLANTQPHLFFGVPRIWDKFREKVLESVPQTKLDKLLRVPVLKNFVKKKIVRKLGLSSATYICSGAAPIATELQEWFQKLGITIHQDYGMTEDCVHAHFNLVGANKFGTVGRPLPGVQTKFTEEGELCVKTECLMLGYYKEPGLTAEVIDDEGYFHTGDIAEYDHDGYLMITGRVKDQFKTDKGKFISPAPIELELLKNNDIGLVCVVGTGIPQPIALVVPSEMGRKKSEREMADSISHALDGLNPGLEAFERVEKAVVMKEEWSVENGLLTPTLKTKRTQIEKLHQGMYPGWFASKERVVFE